MNDGRIYDIGDVFSLSTLLGSKDFEITGVSYVEVEGEKKSFSYTFRDKAELEAEQQKIAEEEARIAQEAAEAAEATAPLNK